jgi:hypothetical protein
LPETIGSIDQPEYFCGTLHDPAEIRTVEERNRRLMKMFDDKEITNAVPATVNVHFHIIQKGDDGYVDDAAIKQQMRVLNRSFERRGVTFALDSVERVDNPSWFLGCQASGVEQQMKSTLHVGNASDLNVYTCEPIGLLGRSTFPWWYADNPSGDGVMIHYGVTPGGRILSYNTGETLVHETGHWLGLYHTFQGGCDGDGDYVADTPDEATAAYSCSIGLDTCPSPGLDPTNNFMDYSGDACWIEFTRDQYTRMAEAYAIYRAGQ